MGWDNHLSLAWNGRRMGWLRVLELCVGDCVFLKDGTLELCWRLAEDPSL